MGELYAYFRNKYSKKNNSGDVQKKTKVKNTLILLSEQMNPGEILEIEVLPDDLVYVPIVIGEEPLKSTISVVQVEPNIFRLKLLELEI